MLKTGWVRFDFYIGNKNLSLLQITTPLFLLMLTGRASPFLHNGIMEVRSLWFLLGLNLTFCLGRRIWCWGGLHLHWRKGHRERSQKQNKKICPESYRNKDIRRIIVLFQPVSTTARCDGPQRSGLHNVEQQRREDNELQPGDQEFYTLGDPQSEQGSRLKTPVLPIWVTCINNEWGVLFNPNRDLMKSYSAENR